MAKTIKMVRKRELTEEEKEELKKLKKRLKGKPLMGEKSFISPAQKEMGKHSTVGRHSLTDILKHTSNKCGKCGALTLPA